MIISVCENNKRIYQSYRNKDGTKVEEFIKFRPYFFVKETENKPATYPISKYINGNFQYEEGEFYNLEKEKLVKVYYQRASDSKAKDCFKQTYEADVPLHFRYAVDEINEMPEYKMRKWYWDMEWQQGGEHDGCITTIVVYDNYRKKYIQWAWFPEGHQCYVSSQRIGYN